MNGLFVAKSKGMTHRIVAWLVSIVALIAMTVDAATGPEVAQLLNRNFQFAPRVRSAKTGICLQRRIGPGQSGIGGVLET
ncbi:hypothetical protein QZH47_13545 [Pseudomonas corrugata]